MAGSAVILKVLDTSKITVLQSNQQCNGQSERNQEIQDYVSNITITNVVALPTLVGVHKG